VALAEPHITSTFKEAPKVEEDEWPPQEEQLFGLE
jgi:hypothetical protein